MGYIPGGVPFTSGVLSSVSLPRAGFTVIDSQFSVPFSLDIDQPASLYMGIGDNGIGSYSGGSIQVIFDFSDNIAFAGSILGFTPDQGFALTSVTLSDGTPLENAGLKFEFIPENTLLTAGASAFDAQGAGLVNDKQTPLSNVCGRAAVFLAKATATSKLEGGFDICSQGIKTNSLVDLDINPEPDPFVFDLAFATVSGSNNIRLTQIEQHSTPVPDPSNIVGLGTITALGFGTGLKRKLTQTITNNKDD